MDLTRGALVDASGEPRTTAKPSRVSCGNAGAVESVESQRQASHSFHEPLGNLAKSRRDSHISTAPTTRADGKVENQKQVFHFPTAPTIYLSKPKHARRAAIAPPPGMALRATPTMTTTNPVTFSREATRPGKIIVADRKK